MSDAEAEIPSDSPSSAGTAESAEIPASESVEESKAESEETPVIDVHPPHHPIHSWKEYLLHMSTIVLGLLIAIGLEQSVELVHRAQERHQLEDDLRIEGENNRGHVQIDINVYSGIVAWLLELQRGVDAERDSGGKMPFAYPARPDGVPDSPRYAAYHVLETEVWDTAKSSSELVLLPRNEVEIYARNYIQAEQVQEYRDRVRQIGIQQGAFETRFSHGTYPPVFDLSKLTPLQLDEYEAILTDQLEEIRVATSRLKIFNAANEYVLSGGRSEKEIREAILKANSPQ